MLRSPDFARVLATRPRARTPHFALHHVSAAPLPARRPVVPELSTGGAPIGVKPVDDLPTDSPNERWMGAVVPKRHARRAVTRNLLKRQIRAAWQRHGLALPNGMWVVRLRGGFDPRQFTSAASGALRAAARTELDQLLAQAAR